MEDKAATMHEHVGRRIAAVRKARGLTQAQLGSTLGWTSQVVSFVERGRRQIDVDELIVVARALGVAGISLLLPVGDDQTTRVALSSGDVLDADGVRDTVMGAGAAEQRKKVAEAIRRRQEELNIPALFDWLRAVDHESEEER